MVNVTPACDDSDRRSELRCTGLRPTVVTRRTRRRDVTVGPPRLLISLSRIADVTHTQNTPVRRRQLLVSCRRQLPSPCPASLSRATQLPSTPPPHSTSTPLSPTRPTWST